MSTNKMILLAFAILFINTSCSNNWFKHHNGNIPTNERISKVKIGMSKEEVKESIGAPSNIISFDNNTWIYMSSEMEEIAFLSPKEIDRKILVIKFDKYEQVDEINRLSKEDGKNIKIDETRTDIKGKEQGFFDRYFGGVGQYSPMGPSKR